MKKIKLFILVALLAQSNELLATTFTLSSGWNLLGTVSAIPVSQILSNTNVKNVVIYQNGIYKATSSNGFTDVPAKSGFFVYSDSSATIDLTTHSSIVTLAKVDGSGNELASDAASWKILHIKDANLYVAMKDDFTNGQLFTNVDATGEAATYCNNLVTGSISGWRLPVTTELTGVMSVYGEYASYFTVLSNATSYWTSSVGRPADSSGLSGFFSVLRSGVATASHTNNTFSVLCVKASP